MQDAAPGIPILVFLSPGVDVAASVEAMGRTLGFTADTGRYDPVKARPVAAPYALSLFVFCILYYLYSFSFSKFYHFLYFYFISCFSFSNIFADCSTSCLSDHKVSF